MRADEPTRAEIVRVLDAYAGAYAAKDVDELIAHVAPDADVIFIGTGPDEWVVGTEELRQGFERDVSQAESVHVDFRNIGISAAGPVAWLSGLLIFDVTAGGQFQSLQGRFTAVFEKREDKWLFVQAHYSLPASEQEPGQSYPEGRDKLIL